MNLTQLIYFVMVVDNGSITKAAQQAYITQAAVSKTIKQLEEELHVELFTRKGRSIQLNREGRLFYSYVSDSLKLLDRGVHSLDKIGTIYYPVSILFNVASPLIAKIVVQIKENLPSVKLSITQHIHNNTDLQQFDFIISDQTYKNFDSIPILTEKILIGWNLSDSHSQDKFININALKDEPCIAMSKGYSLRTILDEFCIKNKIHIVPQYETDDPATIRQLMKKKIGWSLVPEVSWHKIHKDIHLLQLTPVSPHRTIFLNSPHHQLSENLREVRDEIFNIFDQYNK